MKTFKQLTEDRGERAYKEAIAMGLKYSGFGYWKDPQTGETKYKTENDTLVPVEADQESELYKGDGPGEGMGTPDGSGMGGMGGGMTNGAGMLTMRGQQDQQAGQGVLGAPEAGKEQAPKDNDWEPGPDGDTCAGPDAEPPGEVERDSFVGRSNFLKWTAGSDGDNMNTVDYEMVAEGTRTDKSYDAVVDKVMKDEGIPKGYMGLTTRVKNLRNKAKTGAAKQMNMPGFSDQTGPQTKDAISALKKMSNNAREDALASMDDSARKTRSDDIERPGSMTRDNRAKLAQNLIGPKAADREMVKDMNGNLQRTGILSQPDYDIEDTLNNGQYLGQGAFGRVMMSPDKKSVVKEGGIGMEELEVLGELKNHPNFPTLLNAEFTEPFYHDSEVAAKISGRSSGGFNPDSYDSDDFEKAFPVAQGKYAMSAAKGRELSDAFYDIKTYSGDPRGDKAKLQRAVHDVFADMHRRGVAHNDRHGGNILADYDMDDDGMFTLNDIHVIDLGLANKDYMRALMEATGGYTGNDYQLTSKLGIGNDEFDDDLYEEFGANYENMLNRAWGMHSETLDPGGKRGYEGMESHEQAELDDLEAGYSSPLKGGIRTNNNALQGMAEEYPFLGDDDKVRELIEIFYEGMGTKGKTLQDRMSRGYDAAMDSIGTDKGMSPGQGRKMMSVVNKMRKEKGQPRLNIKGLDHDD